MTTYSQMPVASVLTGAEILPLTQSGVTVQSTVDALRVYVAQFTTSQLAPSLNLTCNVSASSTTATFKADQVTLGISLTGALKVLSSVNKTIDLTTVGAGGMDIGTASSGFVAVYLMYNPTTLASALVGTLANSAIAPEIYGGANAPSGYTYSRLVSVWPLASSNHFAAGLQQGRVVSFAETFFTPGFSIVAWTSVSISSVVPISAKSYSGRVSISYPGGAALAGYGLSPLGSSISQQVFLIDNSNAAETAGSFSVRDMPIVTAQTTFYEITSTAIDSGGGFGISSYTF